MRRILMVVMVVSFLFGGAVWQPRTTSAQVPWPPLLNCADVTASGSVTLDDIFGVIGRFGASYPAPEYLLLYDLDGGANISLDDIFVAVTQFGTTCPMIETQVALATLATIKYRDPAVAAADGYIQSSQYVPNMGIHMANLGYQVTYYDLDDTTCTPGSLSPTCQLDKPVGLLYTEGPGGGPEELIGLWYVVPIDVLCQVYGIDPDGDTVPGPCQDALTQPVGFGTTNTDEDNIDPDGPGPQRGWHVHPDLCVWNWGTPSAAVAENVPLADCQNTGGVHFSTYGWMVHLYNFVPNPDGRFQNWSCNIPGGVVTC